MREILVTSALPYANGYIHLGHLVEYIQTDIWVRAMKAQGHQVTYVCADDAHGTAIMLKAEANGVTPEEQIASVKASHEADFSKFLINFDNYHSTHSEENKQFSELIYRRLNDAGHISTKDVEQLFDPEKQLFLADRFVKGTCPECDSPDQYGDNCEVCGTTYDATVESASGTIGTNGVLTDDTVRTFLRKIRIAGGKDPNVLLGSHEVYSEIQGIYTPQVRVKNPYGEQVVQIDVNGIKTFEGTGVGLHVDSLYGIPFIPSKDAPSDSGDASEVGRLFALDTSDSEGYGYPRLGIQVAIPTEYYEATRRSPGYPFINNAFVEKGLFRTMGETVCRHFKSQGKIRDIKL